MNRTTTTLIISMLIFHYSLAPGAQKVLTLRRATPECARRGLAVKCWIPGMSHQSPRNPTRTIRRSVRRTCSRQRPCIRVLTQCIDHSCVNATHVVSGQSSSEHVGPPSAPEKITDAPGSATPGEESGDSLSQRLKSRIEGTTLLRLREGGVLDREYVRYGLTRGLRVLLEERDPGKIAQIIENIEILKYSGSPCACTGDATIEFRGPSGVERVGVKHGDRLFWHGFSDDALLSAKSAEFFSRWLKSCGVIVRSDRQASRAFVRRSIAFGG